MALARSLDLDSSHTCIARVKNRMETKPEVKRCAGAATDNSKGKGELNATRIGRMWGVLLSHWRSRNCTVWHGAHTSHAAVWGAANEA